MLDSRKPVVKLIQYATYQWALAAGLFHLNVTISVRTGKELSDTTAYN